MTNEAENRFQDFVSVHLDSGAMLACDDERGLIADGISRFQLSADRARGIIAVTAGQTGTAREVEIARAMLAVMRELAGKRGAVDRKAFATGLVVLRALHGAPLPEGRAKAWLKRIVEASGLTVKRRGLFRSRRWFRTIKPAA